jgi:Zn-dependent protease
MHAGFRKLAHVFEEAAGHPHFRLAGIPIRIEWPFFIVAGALGLQLRGWHIAAWVGIVFVSVLVHELGHAIAYRFFRQRPIVVITPIAGMTYGERPLSKSRTVVVSLAGPLCAMAVLGVPAIILRNNNEIWQATHPNWWFVVWEVAFVNIWWSVANLLPILPLDGGHVADALWGRQPARWLSVGFGAAAAVYVYTQGWRWAGLFMALLAIWNLAEVAQERGGLFHPDRYDGGTYRSPPPPRANPRSSHPASRGPGQGNGRGNGRGRGSGSGKRGRGRSGGGWKLRWPWKRRPKLRSVEPPRVTDNLPNTPLDAPGLNPVEAAALDLGWGAKSTAQLEAVAWQALRSGDSSEAASVMQALEHEDNCSPYLSASVAAATGNESRALALFEQAFLSGPPPNLVPATAVSRAGLAMPLATRLLARGGDGVDATSTLTTHLHYASCFVDAAKVGERLAADGRGSTAQTAFEVACSWSQAGEAERGLEWLTRAVDAGFTAPNLIEHESDLAAVRALPGYADVRARLAGGTPTGT